MARFKTGIGGVTKSERRGFSEEDQKTALAECKLAQFRLQEGCCINCTRPMNIKDARWMSSRGATATLIEWSKAMNKTFDQDTLCNILSHRSPDEIRAEYANGNRGHELACRGCAMKLHHCLYGAAGPGAAYTKHYKKLVAERGVTEEQQHNPDVVMELHTSVVSHLGQTRMARLLTATGTVSPKDTERTKNLNAGRSAPRKTRSKYVPRRGKRRALLDPEGNKAIGPNWLRPEADAALAAEQEYERTRPETDMERIAREVLESYTK